MSHEQSRTIQGRDGQWYNVYGEGTGATQPMPLPKVFGFEQRSYPTESQASNAAAWRSVMGEGHYPMQPPHYGFGYSVVPRPPQAQAFGQLLEALQDPRLGMLPMMGGFRAMGQGRKMLQGLKAGELDDMIRSSRPPFSQEMGKALRSAGDFEREPLPHQEFSMMRQAPDDTSLISALDDLQRSTGWSTQQMIDWLASQGRDALGRPLSNK